MKKDRMTANERMKCLFLNEPLDRVPFMPFFVGYLAVDNGVRIREFFAKPDVAFEAGKKTEDKYPWANIRPVYGWADHGAWEFGGKIVWPESESTMTPYTAEPLITRPEQVDKLPRLDPFETEWFCLRNIFNELCVQEGYSAQLPSGSIMPQLASILGDSRLLKWIIKYPDTVHRLARKILDFNLKVAQITLETYGPKNCSVMTDLTFESSNVLSSRAFKEFCLPYIKQIHDLYYESGVQATMMHLCGDHRGNLNYLKEVPLPERTIFSIGDTMDLKDTGGFLGEKYILAGNISTTTLQCGTQEDVREEVERCLYQAKGRKGGFILMPACEYPPMAPRENLEAILKSLNEYGFY